MRVNYEAAYTRLQAWVATEKSGYGRHELLQKMAELQGQFLEPDDNQPEAASAAGAAEPHLQGVAPPATERPEEVHDGSNHRQAAAA